MQVESFAIEGLKFITPDVFGDQRGWFYESYNVDKFKQLGIPVDHWDQDNHSCSVKNTLRGLHFQTSPGQAKIVRCTRGQVWDVAVDIRPHSPTLGQWQAVELDDEKRQMFYIPAGFAHGFCVLSDMAEFQYKCSSVYQADTEAGIAWDDPEFNVQWPVQNPLLSQRDLNNQSFADYKRANGL